MSVEINPDVIQEQFTAWLSDNWNPELSLREWRELLVDSGWAVPHWLLGGGVSEPCAHAFDDRRI